MEWQYNFCREHALKPVDIFNWLELDHLLDNDLANSYDFFGRNLMLLEKVIRISVPHAEFDKWSNSEEFWFEVDDDTQRNAFIDWVIEQRKLEQNKVD